MTTTTSKTVFQVGERRYIQNPGYHWQDDPHVTLCFEIIEVQTEVGQISDDGGESWENTKQTSVKVCFSGGGKEEKTYPVDADLLQTSWSIAEARAMQKKLCLENGWPHFAPYDGHCHSCGKNVYIARNGHGHITGCPHCARSYCD